MINLNSWRPTGALAVLAIALTTTSASAQSDSTAEGNVSGLQAAPMAAKDLITAPRLGAPIVTQSGRYALYSVTQTDPESLERSAVHYMLDLETPGAKPNAFTLPIKASAPAFGANNTLYFLSGEHPDPEAQARTRIWRADMDASGKPSNLQIVFDQAGADISGFLIAPNQTKIALLTQSLRTCEKFACDQTPPDQGGTGRLYEGDAGFFRHWDTWIKPGQFNRVFVFDLEEGKATGQGTPIDGIDPANGLTGNTPTMPFGGLEDMAWAPDDSGLYFVARETGANEPTSTDLNIYFSDLSGAAPQPLTQANPAHDSSPVPSPDGQTLAYLAMERPGYESDRMVIHLRDLASGQTRALTPATDLSFGSITWSLDGKQILATASDVLDTPVFSIDPKSGAVTKLDLMPGNEAHLGAVTPLPNDRILFTRDSIASPKELYLAQGSSAATQLTDVAASAMEQMAPTVTTRFSFKGAQGDTVWGQITRLKNQQGPIPAILYIHGGPQGSFLDAWSSRWNPRVVASQGYAVISVDFHGSTGYGQDFTDSINQDWGGKPLVDLQKGLEAALALDTQIDGSRACAMGASYGGYMVNWIAGNWPDRFNCLVQHDGLFDMRSFYYSTEELWFPRWDFGGSYADNPDLYERWNPVNHVDKWKTPMLVIAGEQDFRVPYTQGLQSFTALQERQIPSQLLVFPDENHWVLGARNSLQWHNTVFAWLDRWLADADAEQ